MYKLKYSYTTRDAAWLPIFIIAVSLCYSFLFSVVITKIAAANGATTEAEVMAFAALPWVNVINMLLGQIFSLLTYFIYAVINGKKAFTASTIKGQFRLYPILITMLITAVCVFGFNYFISIVDVGLVALTGEALVGTAIPTSAIGYIVVVIVFAVLPAFVEELVYRGVVFNGLKKSYKPVASILLSAFLFAMMHLNIHQFIYQYIMGVILACLAHFTGSILYSIVFHLINNFLVVTLSYLVPNIFVVSNMSALNIILIIFGALLASAAITGLFILLCKIVKKYKTEAVIPEEKTEQEQLIENSKGLSEYEIRQLNPTKIKDKTLITILTISLVVLWIATVFG